jgi:hypothetical protein
MYQAKLEYWKSQANQNNADAGLKNTQSQWHGTDVSSMAGLRGAQGNLYNQQAQWHGADMQSQIGLRGAQSANYMSEANHRNKMSPLLQTNQSIANDSAEVGLTQAIRLDPLHERAVNGLSYKSDADLGSLFMSGSRPSDKVEEAFTGRDKVQGVHPLVDTEPYMLSDKEAVLNAAAAEKLGYDKIAKLNAEGRKAMGLRGKSSPVVKDGVKHAAVGEDRVRSDDGHPYSKTKRVHIPGTPEGPIYVNARGTASEVDPRPLNKQAYGAVKNTALEGYDVVKTHGPKVLKALGKGVTTLAVPALTAVDANSNLDQNAEFYRDPSVSGYDKFKQRLRDVGQPIIQNGLAGAGAFVGSGAATPFVGGVVGGSLGYSLGGAINSVIDDEGEALRKWRASYVPNKGVLDANAARNADRVQNKATANPNVKVPEGYVDPAMREALAKADARQKQMDKVRAYDKEAGLRGNLAMLSFAQMGGNQQAGLALKNAMDADTAKMNAAVEIAKARAKDSENKGMSMGDIEKFVTNTYGEGMLQPIMQGAEQLRGIDIENARARGDMAAAEKAAGQDMTQYYVNRAAHAVQLQNSPHAGDQATKYGIGGALAGMAAGAGAGWYKGKKLGGLRGALVGGLGGGLLGGLAGGTAGWTGGGVKPPAELGLDPYRNARVIDDRVVYQDKSGNTVGYVPVEDVNDSLIPQLYAQSQ